MNQDINVLIEAYRQNLIKLTQSSQLPIGVVKYVLSDITTMINNEYNAYIQEAMTAQRRQQEEAMRQQPQEDSSTTLEGEVE